MALDCFPCNNGSVEPDPACPECDPETVPSWATSLIMLFRIIIGDLNCPYTYDDCRVVQLLEGAAYLIIGDLCGCPTICANEILDEEGNVILDPVASPVLGNLLVLKAACLVDVGLLRSTSISESFRAVCGPASLQVSKSASALAGLLAKGPCAAYESTLEGCCYKNPMQTAAYAKIILSAFGDYPSSVNINDCNNPNGLCGR